MDGSTQSGDGQSTTDQAKDKAQEVAGQAQEKAQNLAGQTQDRVKEQVDQRSTEAGEQVGSTAKDLREVGQQLKGQGNDNAAKVAEQVADRGEKVGDYLRDSDGQKILSDVEDLARRQPWLTLAGGAILGVAAARFLKASSSERYSQRSAGGSSGSPYGGGSIPRVGSYEPAAGTSATVGIPTPAPVVPQPAGTPAV